MPQDRLRSVVYRSFVTCDDPKGVADSKKTIRKSKKAEEPRVKKTTSHDEEERGKDLQLQKLSDFRVMEVSRGAEKLSEVIGSLSNRPSFDYDTTSNHIATDLLRGALDLQGSLVMLGKFQEASKFITNKHKEKKKKKKREFPDFTSFEDGFEKPRISASRDCYDELREVIKESFARQNLLPKLEVAEVDLPSSSSSSSLNYARSSPPTIRGGENMKGSNLIAKLMGLEEVPSKAGAIFRKVEKEKEERVPYQRGLLLDIDLPRAKKPEFMVKKVVRERRTLEEIIETMQFKGILERKCVDVDVDGYNDCKLYTNPSFLSRELAADQGPPIVIMKPLRGEEPRVHRDCINGGEDFKSRQLPRKMREEKSAVKQKVDKGKEEKNVGKVGVRPVKKAVDSQDRVSTKKMNQSKPLLPQIPKKEAVQKVEKIAKVAKPQRSDKPQDLAKLTIVKQNRNVRENNAPKAQIARAKVVAADKGMKPKKNLRNGESKRKPSSASVENRKGDGNSTIHTEIIIGETFVMNQEPERAIVDVTTAYYTSDDSRNAASSPSDASWPITKDGSNHIEDDSYIPSFDSDQIKGWKGITNTRHLLLGSTSFLNHIEELFDTGTHDSTVFHTTCLHDSELLHDSLLLDCAKEILQHRSLHCMSMRNQWSENFSRRPKYYLPIEKLVDEISSSIEDLQNYSKSCGDLVLADSIYPMLERDLWWNEEVTGSWDSGWRKRYPIGAVDEVMHDLEELVLSEIVAELITGIM